MRTRASKLGGHALFCDRSLPQECQFLTNKRLHKKLKNLEHTTSHKILVEFYTDTLELIKTETIKHRTPLPRHMIAKVKDDAPPSDRFGKAGYDAEKQMAFYLRRAFADKPDVFVFNDIKFKRNREAAQIDHLVLHPFGFYLVESKSVTGSISVNAQGEYSRHYGNKTTGMKSPVAQVKMQGQLLQQLLTDNRTQLLGKALLGMVQKSFHQDRFRFLVAISDHGQIKRQGSAPSELVKADAVTFNIENHLRFQTQFTGSKTALSFLKASNADIDQRIPPWTAEELTTLRDFITANDSSSPSPTLAITGKSTATTQPQVEHVDPIKRSQKVCKKCGETAIEIRYGKYGYYFKCLSCDGNTPVDSTCPGCNQKAKLRKSKKQFFWNCSCGFESLYFENP